jgi:DNA-binding GntR family transcriptional regulator
MAARCSPPYYSRASLGPSPDGGDVNIDNETPRLETLSSETTLTTRATNAIRQAIHEGRLVTGRLYSVAELAEQFGVSRTPVREALLMLEQYDMVRFARNRGVRIVEMSARGISDVFALRLLLEVPATRRACALISDEDIAALDAELADMKRLRDAGDEPGFMAHDKRFHEIVLRAAGNERLVTVVSHMRDLVRLHGASTVGQSRSLETIFEEHEAIYAAVAARDAARAAHAMSAHLQATGRLLIEQEGGDPADLAWAAPS